MRKTDSKISTLNGVRTLSAVMGTIWLVFVAAMLSGFVLAQSTGYRPVVVNNTYIGNVELYNLVGNRGCNVIFHPVNNDLFNIINDYHLNWIQVWNRPNDQSPQWNLFDNIHNVVPNSQGIDPPNGGYNYQPGGSDNDPSYYTNNDRTAGGGGFFNANIIFAENNWWIRDWPGPLNGFDAETWLVTSENNNIRRLVCFNWTVGGNGGTLNENVCRQPNFINNSAFNTNQIMNGSGFGSQWHVFDVAVACPGTVRHLQTGGPGIWEYDVILGGGGPVTEIIFSDVATGTIPVLTAPASLFFHVAPSANPHEIIFEANSPYNGPFNPLAGFSLHASPSTGGSIEWGTGLCADNVPGPEATPAIVCPPGAIAEGEPLCSDGYDDQYNGGCNAVVPVFSPISLGQTVCGASGTFLLGGEPARDTDWYQLYLPSTTYLAFAVTAGFSATTAILSPGMNGCNDLQFNFFDPGSQPFEGSIGGLCLSSGTYWLFVAPENFEGVTCGAQYTLTVSGATCPPPPANDDCIHALELSPGGTSADDNSQSTMDSFTDCGGGPATHNGNWYKVKGTGTVLSASTCDNATNFDTEISVLCGDCSNPNCFAHNDDYCGLQSQVSWCSEPGVDYLICVYGYGDAIGNYRLWIYDEQQPCSNYPVCPSCDLVTDLTVAYDPLMAQVSLGFTAPQAGTYRIWATDNPDNDGDPNGGADLDWTQVATVLCAAPGSYQGDDVGPLHLHRYYAIDALCSGQIPVPGNDNCADATAILDGTYSFSTVSATTDGPADPLCYLSGYNQTDKDVWFCYTSTCNDLIFADLCGSDFDSKISVYNGCLCPPSGPPIACNDDACGLQSQLDFPGLSGQTYLIRVGGHLGASGNAVLNIACALPSLRSNTPEAVLRKPVASPDALGTKPFHSTQQPQKK